MVAAAYYPHLAHTFAAKMRWVGLPSLGELVTEAEVQPGSSNDALDWSAAFPSLTRPNPAELELSALRLCADNVPIIIDVPFESAETKYPLYEVRSLHKPGHGMDAILAWRPELGTRVVRLPNVGYLSPAQHCTRVVKQVAALPLCAGKHDVLPTK